jgi:hypothetical protein
VLKHVVDDDRVIGPSISTTPAVLTRRPLRRASSVATGSMSMPSASKPSSLAATTRLPTPQPTSRKVLPVELSRT